MNMDNNARSDVFLSHSSADRHAVLALARNLVRGGIRPWLDQWNLVPGEPWQKVIEDALANSDACAVCIGPSGIGPWQHEEMRAAIDRRVTERGSRFPVIPVLLPGTSMSDRAALPTFLRATTWVVFLALDDTAALERLICGIRGVQPLLVDPPPGSDLHPPVRTLDLTRDKPTLDST
jgi:hypothetical protein